MEKYPYFNEEHEMFRQTVDKFVEKHCSREYIRDCDTNRKYPYEAYEEIAKQGWFSITVPEELGGMGADILYRVILQEGLARYAFDMGAVYGLTSWGIDCLISFGTKEQLDKYLEPAMEGKIRFSISMTEPNAGSDLSGISLSAVDNGDSYILNGQKVFSSAAGAENNIILVACRTAKSEKDRHHGITLFLVPNITPGVEIRRLNTLSRRMSGTCEVFFDNVQIPKENMVGELHKGWEVLGSFLVKERVGGAAMYVGNATTALNDALSYAKQRTQFGKPIGKFQAISHMLADMYTDIETARLLTYQVAWLESQGIPCRKEAAMAKLYASEAGLRVTTMGMQILGGYAQLAEYDMERYFRDAKQNTVSAGTSQIQRSIIAKEVGL